MALSSDTRAVSPVIGAVLLFGIAIILFSLYGAFVIPNENAQVEFDHLQTVENDFTSLRADLLNAKRTGEQRTSVVNLGTTYPSRPLAFNPPDPTGRLRTVNSGAVEFSNTDGVSASALCSGGEAATIETRSLRYEPQYNQLQTIESVTYEHTFVGRSFTERTLFGPQDFVKVNDDGDVTAIDLVVLTGDYSQEGAGLASLDLQGTGTNTTRISEDSVTITIPSQFSAAQWETEILAGVNVDATQSGERVALTFDTPGTVDLSCSAVGIGRENPSPEYEPLAGSAGEDSGPNSVAPGDVKFVNATILDSTGGLVEVNFTNLGGTDRQITAARINFYNMDSPGQNREQVTEAHIADTQQNLTTGNYAYLEIAGPFNDTSNLGMMVPSSGSGLEPIYVDFDPDDTSQQLSVEAGDWFVLTVEYDDEVRAQYFIQLV